jgi:hypothetical protein
MFKWTVLALAGLTGCSEYELGSYVPPVAEPGEEAFEVTEDEECVGSAPGFDIEEVSALQDAFGLPMVRDGLTLPVQDDFHSGERTWRPVGVEVLVMFPEWYFNQYNDGNKLRVHVYDSATPTQSAPYSKGLTIRKADLEWSDLLLPANADWSGDDREQVAAWVYFDLSDVVPESGFNTSSNYFVAVEWDGIGIPNVGYSNFNLPCQQNWTDYGDGAWKQNTGNDCSWPMLKIDVELRDPDECE